MPSFSKYICICKPPGCNSGGILEGAKAKKQHKTPSTSNSCWIFKTAHQTFYIHVAITTYNFARLSSSSILISAGTSSPEVGVNGQVRPRKRGDFRTQSAADMRSEPSVNRACVDQSWKIFNHIYTLHSMKVCIAAFQKRKKYCLASTIPFRTYTNQNHFFLPTTSLVV